MQLGLGLGLTRRSGGAPVLALVTDSLDADPPTYIFTTTLAGTVTWDFDTSISPPTAGAGDIATGTEAVTAGSNTITLDLSAYAGSTGYIHWRQGASNVLTSQQITVPTPELITDGGFDGDGSAWTITGGSISGGAVSATGAVTLDIQQTGLSITGGNSYTISFDWTMSAGVATMYFRLGGTTNLATRNLNFDVSPGTATATVTAESANSSLRLILPITTGGAVATIDNISVVPA